MSDKKRRFETNAIRSQIDRTQYREHSVPMFLTSSFTFEDAEHMRSMFAGESEGIIYSRYANPNTNEFITKICEMENAEAGFAMASGMSAVFNSIAAFLNSGDHIIASRAVFGSTHQVLTQILPRWGITHTYVDPTNVESWDQHVQSNTKMVIIETPSNPGLTLIDLEAVGHFSKKHNLLLNVDNCFATPYLQKPINFGADIVTHSGTKFIDGQGRVLAGIIVGSATALEKVQFFARHTGPSLSPFNAWILSKSLETLAVRMDRHCSNALRLAEYLEQHPNVKKVNYPFLPSHPQYDIAKKQMSQGGGIVSFEVNGGLAQGSRFIDGTNMVSISSNLGDTRTIITHPATTTHSKLTVEERASVGITDGLIRISVGLENIKDIIEDVETGLMVSSKIKT